MNIYRGQKKANQSNTIAPVQEQKKKKKIGRPTDKKADKVYKKTTIRIEEDVLYEMRRFLIGHDKWGSMDSFIESAVRRELKRLGREV